MQKGVDSYLNKVTEEHQRFLAERYVEDAGYCSVVRKSVTEKLPESMNYFDVREPDGMVACYGKRRITKIYGGKFILNFRQCNNKESFYAMEPDV